MGFGSKVGFCPYTWPYPPFLALAPWLFLGSVAGRLKSPSLLIQNEGYRNLTWRRIVLEYQSDLLSLRTASY
jgi:hypothetical protein